jgi:uroporphyrin-III C-methyltransferase
MTTDDTPPPVTPPAPSPASPADRFRINPWLVVALAALLLAGWQWLETRQQLGQTQVEVARRLAEAEAGQKEARGALKQLSDQVEALQGKLGAAEARIAEFQGQTSDLQALYQDLARGREEATLLEIEQSVSLAAQQLQLAGNVQAAVLALQSADARLARLDRPQLLALRKAVNSDLETLTRLPFIDVAGLSLRLEQIIAGIDRLPLLAHGRPPETSQNAAAPETVPLAWWQLAASELWQGLKGLVRIQRFDQAAAPLLAPGQEFFLRENLKLRLLNARLAMFAREQSTFRNELKVSQEWLSAHFDTSDKTVQAAQAQLRQLLASDIVVELPNLNASQAALRTARQTRDPA